jgi:hypothetical protein
MTKQNQSMILDMLNAQELAPLLEADRRLNEALASLATAKQKLQSTTRELAETDALDRTDLQLARGRLFSEIGAWPGEIGELQRRKVLLHLAALKVQRDRKRLVYDELAGRFSEKASEMQRLDKAAKGERAAAFKQGIELHAATASQATLNELKQPGRELSAELTTAEMAVGICDAWAANYAEQRGASTGMRMPPSPLDNEASWPVIAHEQGEKARKEVIW